MEAPQVASPQTAQNLDLSSATDVVCESCGSRTFREVAFIKKVSALMSPNGRETIVPIGTFACSMCNHINKPFDPFATKE